MTPVAAPSLEAGDKPDGEFAAIFRYLAEDWARLSDEQAALLAEAAT